MDMKIEGMMLAVTVVRGEGLAAKDRNWRGKKTTSDPYVVVEVHTKTSPNSDTEVREIFKTKTIHKTLDPVWNESGKLEAPLSAENLQDESNPPILVIRVFDHDVWRKDDSMGCVCIPLKIASRKLTKSCIIPASSAKGAKGKLVVKIESKVLYGVASDSTPTKSSPLTSKYSNAGLGLLGISVHCLSGDFMDEVRSAGLTAKAKIYEIENLNGPEGIIRRKGKNAVCPISKKRGAAYVHCLEGADNVGRATHMLSYTWGYAIGDIVDTLVDFCQTNELDPKRTYIWICCLCVNQHRVVEMNNSGTLGESVVDFEKEFRDRVVGVGHILPLMAPWDSPSYLTRVWCIFEIYTAMQNNCKVSIIMPPNEKARMTKTILSDNADGANSLYEALANTKVENAEASVEKDRTMILGMLKRGAGFHATNSRVNEYIRDWVSSTVNSIVETRARDLVVTATKEEKVEFAKLRIAVGTLFDRNGAHDAALDMLYKAQQLVEDTGGSPSANATLWNSIGLCLDSKGQYTEAYAMYSAALTIYTAMYGEEHKMTTSIANNMGMTLMNLGKADTAAQILKQNLEVRKRTLHKKHPDLALSYSNLGVALQELGDLDGAQKVFEACLGIRLKVFGANHPEIAGTRSNLGFILLKRRKFRKAECEFKKCLKFYEVSMGKDHPECARIHQNLGGLYHEKLKFSDALRHYERAGAILAATVGENNLWLARNHDCRGDLLVLMNKDDEAMVQLEASLKILRAICGPDHREIAGPLRTMGAIFVKQENYEKAREKFSEALRIQERAQGVDPREVKETRMYIALVDGLISKNKPAAMEPQSTKLFSFEEAERIFNDWKCRFFNAETKFRELYYKGGTTRDARAVDSEILTLLADAHRFGVHHGMSEYFTPYIIIMQELHRNCLQMIQSDSVRRQGSQTEAIGEMIGGNKPLSDTEASRNPEFVEWKKEFFAIEKRYHSLLRKPNSTGEEFREIIMSFKLRVIWTDTVEEAVGFANLKVYMALITAYTRILESMESAAGSNSLAPTDPASPGPSHVTGRGTPTIPSTPTTTATHKPSFPSQAAAVAREPMASSSSPLTVSMMQTTIQKGPDGNVGIGVQNVKGADGKSFPVVVLVEGASAKTSLLGLRVHTVNGAACLDAQQVAIKMCEAPSCALTITAGSHNTVVAWVDKMGFSIFKHTGGGLDLMVGSLTAEQQKESGLKEGMIILQVNGVYVNDLDQEGIIAAMTHGKHPNGLTVVAMDKPRGPFTLSRGVENPNGLPTGTPNCPPQ